MARQRPSRRDPARWLDDLGARIAVGLARRVRTPQLERRVLAGRALAEIALHEGARHGVARSWRWDGSLREEAHWRANALHGRFRAWRRGEILAEECTYDAGRLEGPASAWYPDGSKRWVGHFAGGKPHGEWFFFDRAGRL